ncbi:MAG: putative DNA binding domain-containing protein [Oscillospiraceae bacterium]|nr:putative DNA binding domain-containing protein [Oscillospiraceae bacterium]
MKFKESETVELKRMVVDDIKKTIVAFANSDGGKLYIGVEDSGDVLGVDKADEVLLKVNNMIRDSIKPDVTMFAQSAEEEADGKRIVSVTVSRGSDRPYYLAGKGLRPEGVFVRHGTASVPATDTAIRRMIKETDGDSFEEVRSINQDLTFKAASAVFKERNIDFGAAQMMTLKLTGKENMYTNLGLLLSDQCTHTVKTAVFQDETMKVFKDRREFSGSLFKQLDDAHAFIDMHNPIKATFNKLLRIDTRGFPEDAVREALLNALVHREYSMSGSILIKLFTDRIEFISVGGLLRGIEVADIMSGFSICRNQNLAAVFYRLHLIEAYGTGMQKITEAYVGSGKEPIIEVTPNVFKVVLPNINSEKAAQSNAPTVMTPEEQIRSLAVENGSIDRKGVESLLGLSQTPAGQLLKKLTDSGVLIKKGNGKNTRYYTA